MLSSCTSEPKLHSFIGSTMGTTYSVKVYTDKQVDVDALKKEVDQKLKDFNQALSTYIPDSEISRFNKEEAGKWIEISDTFEANMNTAKKIFEKSEGLYDVSITPLVERWRFGAKKFKDWKFPNTQEIQQIQKCIGLDKFEYGKGKIKKVLDCQALDFSSLAKGQGVDLVADYIRTQGYKNAMIEIGGEVKVLGSQGDQKWRIGVESPRLDKKLASIIEMKDSECVATSGGYRNFFEYEGKQYSHTINPKTGFPVNHRTVSATVIADSCIEADAWATAFMVMGYEKSLELAKKEGIWSRIMVENSDQLETFSTGAH